MTMVSDSTAEPLLRVTAGSGCSRSGSLLTERWRVEGNVYIDTLPIHAE